MKVYIQTDIEGIAGFVFFENGKEPGAENLAHRIRMRELLTAEVNAAVKASFKAGAREVVVNDSHGSGYNIIFEKLDPRCEIVHGRNCSGPHWLPEFGPGFDALVLVGQHAMGGTKGAILAHSLWRVNNGEIFLGEGSMAAAIAGDYNVPTVFVSGDDYITAEMREKIPSIQTVQVKKALGTYIARSLIPSRACEMIFEGVKNALRRADKVQPYVIKGPVSLNLLEGPHHGLPFKQVLKKDIKNDTISGAFSTAVKNFPWNNFDVQLPDGFSYP